MLLVFVHSVLKVGVQPSWHVTYRDCMCVRMCVLTMATLMEDTDRCVGVCVLTAVLIRTSHREANQPQRCVCMGLGRGCCHVKHTVRRGFAWHAGRVCLFIIIARTTEVTGQH